MGFLVIRTSGGLAGSDGFQCGQAVSDGSCLGDLDYLIMDLPPGTGDIQLTIVQTVPLAGAVIVSTPQDVALDDARKGVAMFRKVNVPVLGIVENMAYFTPPNCPVTNTIFSAGMVPRNLAAAQNVPFLGEVPSSDCSRGWHEGVPVANT